MIWALVNMDIKRKIGLGPKYTFGKKLKKLKKFMNPGPGTYNIKTNVFNGPRYTMGLKIDEEESKNEKNKDKKTLVINIPSDIFNNKGFSFPKAEAGKTFVRIAGKNRQVDKRYDWCNFRLFVTQRHRKPHNCIHRQDIAHEGTADISAQPTQRIDFHQHRGFCKDTRLYWQQVRVCGFGNCGRH